MTAPRLRTDTASTLIDAPAAQIYRAFETAEAMLSWLPPQGMTGELIEFDFREGGAYRLRLTYADSSGSPGKTSVSGDEVAVRFIGLVADRRIEQAVTFDSDDPAFAGEMRITWTLEPADGGGTLVSIRCEDVPLGISADDHQEGLRSTLRNLAEFVASPP